MSKFFALIKKKRKIPTYHTIRTQVITSVLNESKQFPDQLNNIPTRQRMFSSGKFILPVQFVSRTKLVRFIWIEDVICKHLVGVQLVVSNVKIVCKSGMGVFLIFLGVWSSVLCFCWRLGPHTYDKCDSEKSPEKSLRRVTNRWNRWVWWLE